MLFVELD
jgi:hypothetical protein